MTDHIRIIGPLTYAGKPGCQSAMCRSWFNPNGGTWDCIGWHCAYCDELTSYQGHNCDVAVTMLTEAERLMNEP